MTIYAYTPQSASLSLIRIKQEAKGYGRSPLDFTRSDFAAAAEAFGAVGERVGDAGGLAAALHAETGEIALMPSPGGFRNPAVR